MLVYGCYSNSPERTLKLCISYTVYIVKHVKVTLLNFIMKLH